MAESDVSDAIHIQNEKIQQLEERLDHLEREQSAGLPNLMDVLDRFFPRNVREHLRAARREQLLAARALIDDLIEGMEESSAKSNPRRRIDVE
ncbi:MAG TPA: hypothetical protein VFZ25_12300 [Chloroflexota bacterium]|nr:hypothetical protein [Chloroflexota bacterium]